MTVDEFETIRLIDLDGLTQEECANQMNISRTTVQGIYDQARRKLAESLVNGKVLWIEGGEYQLCDGRGNGCGRAGCRRHRCGRGFAEEPEAENNLNVIITEDSDENSDTSRGAKLLIKCVPILWAITAPSLLQYSHKRNLLS